MSPTSWPHCPDVSCQGRLHPQANPLMSLYRCERCSTLYDSSRIEHVPCTICATPTPMTGTKLCNGCWELGTRIESDPQLARVILERVENNQDWRQPR